MLTATIRGAEPLSVWLAPTGASPARALLTRVDDREYQINLYETAVYDILRESEHDSFRIHAEIPGGETISSVAVRYALPKSVTTLDLPWDRSEVTIYQRSARKIPGSNGRIWLRIGDITAGQVIVSVSDTAGNAWVDMKSMRQGAATPFVVGGKTYRLVLDRLVNLLVGRDFAVFSLVPEDRWRRQSVQRLLATIEDSNLTFVRNGADLSATQFATRLRNKLGLIGSAELSVDEFIEHVASQSSTTGHPYLVKHPDGSTEPVAGWLRRQDVSPNRPAATSRPDDATTRPGAGQ